MLKYLLVLFFGSTLFCCCLAQDREPPPPPASLGSNVSHVLSDSFSITIHKRIIEHENEAFDSTFKISVALEAAKANAWTTLTSLGTLKKRTRDSESYKRTLLPKRLIDELYNIVSKDYIQSFSSESDFSNADSEPTDGTRAVFSLNLSGKRYYRLVSDVKKGSPEEVLIELVKSKLDPSFHFHSLEEENLSNKYLEGDIVHPKDYLVEEILGSSEHDGHRVRLLGKLECSLLDRESEFTIRPPKALNRPLGPNHVAITNWSHFSKRTGLKNYDGKRVRITGVLEYERSGKEYYVVLRNVTNVEPVEKGE